MTMTEATLKTKLIELYEAQTEDTYEVHLDSDENVSGSTKTEGANKTTSTEMGELFDVIAGAIVAQLADEGVALGNSTADKLDVG